MRFRFTVLAMYLVVTAFPAALAQATPPGVLPPAQTAAPVAEDYVLGAEDVIAVSVLRHEELSGEYLIPKSGVVQIKAVGDVKAVGLTLQEMKALVLHKLRDRLRNPEVSVSLKVARQQRVYVLGEVESPGVFDWKPGWGIVEAISAASGIVKGIQTQDCKVIVERFTEGKSERREFLLDDVLNGSSSVGNGPSSLPEAYTLSPGDIVRVQAIAYQPVYVTGKVKMPGLYRMRSDSMGILEAIAQAQGVLEGAALTNIKVVHMDGSEEIVDLSAVLTSSSMQDRPGDVPRPANAGAVKLPKLRGGDIILVPELLDRFAVLGYVTKPGFYNLPSGRRFTLAEALAAAEGATQRGRISRVGLVRFEGGKEVRKVYDLGKYLRGGDDKQNPLILPGDVLFVPETNRVDLATVLSGISATGIFFNAIRP